MSPSPNQFPPSSSGSDQAQTSEPVIRRPNPPKSDATPKSDPTPKSGPAPKSDATPKSDPTPTTSQADSKNESSEANLLDQDTLSRQQPIPPPSEPMQYRAIGLVRGRYAPSEEQFTRGTLVATDGRQIDAVLLGRVMSLVKNHLDLANEHLWVVYPRTRQEQGDLHVQIVGVWEPEKLDKERSASDSTETAEPPSVDDGYFSIRGEVVFQSHDEQKIVIKIKQAARKENDKPKFFKLTLKGVLERKAVGHFWDFQVQRDADTLLIQKGEDIASVRPRRPGKPRPGGKRPGGKKPWQQSRPQRPGEASTGPTPGGRPSPPRPASATQKPIPRPKRQQPSGEGGSN